MRSAAVLAAALALAAPTTARAAAFGELPVLTLSTSGRCLAATGAPGELVRSSPAGAHFMRLSASGIADGETVVTGVASGQCPQVAAQPSGAGIVAQAGAGLWVATRDPGAAWATPVRLSGGDAGPAADAVASSGAAVVAWIERSGTRAYAVKVARRDAGGAFGPEVTLVSATAAEPQSFLAGVQAGIADDGEALVTWTAPGTDDVALEAAVAPPGGAFGPVQHIARAPLGTSTALAEARDGRALLAFWNGKAIEVAERAPGAAFAAPVAIAPIATSAGLSAAIGAGGGAVVAWGSTLGGTVAAATRSGPGAFSAPVAIASTSLNSAGGLVATLFNVYSAAVGLGTSVFGEGGPDLRTIVTPGGSALVAWTSLYGTAEARYATLPLAGGHLDRGPLGASLREVDAATPVLLGDGRAAFAWSDSGNAGARLHAAVEGVTTPPGPAAPGVTIGRPLDTVLSSDEPLRLPVRCSAACDVAGAVGRSLVTAAYVSLPAAGKGTLVIRPELGALAPARRGPVRLELRFGAPGAVVAERRGLTVTLSQAKHKPGPKVRDVTVARDGDDLVVRWRSGHDADPDAFLVLGGATSDLADARALGDDAKGKHGSYSARLQKAAGVRYVTVLGGDDYGISSTMVVKVK